MSMNQFAGLRKIRRLVESYQRPAGDFDPAGAWSHRYHLYIIAGARFAHQGTIWISRKPDGAGTRLEVLTERPTTEPTLKHYTKARLECADNLLSSPRRWTVSTKVAAADSAEPYLQSGMTKTMELKDGQVCISVEGKPDRTIPVSELYGSKFCMLDALQRFPAEKGFAIPEFSLFDEYDQLRAGYRVNFRKSEAFQMKDEAAKLSLFTMTGTGQIPASYWRDASGRLLFFISGLEVYVLSEEDGAPIDFYGKPDVFEQSVRLMKGEKQ